MNIFSKKIKFVIFTFHLLASSIVFLPQAMAAPLSGDLTKNMSLQQSSFLQKAGFSSATNIQGIIALGIQVFLSLLSIIFIVLILYAGFSWMTAGGDEKKIENAKGTIQRAVIGLVIIIAAFTITYFIFSNLPWGISATG